MPTSRPHAVLTSWLPAARSRATAEQRSRSRPRPALASADRPLTRTGRGAPSTVTRSSRQPVSIVVGGGAGVTPGSDTSAKATGRTEGSPAYQSGAGRGSTAETHTRGALPVSSLDIGSAHV